MTTLCNRTWGMRRGRHWGTRLGQGGIAEKMAALGCRQAERLLWAYLGALGDSGRAYSDFIRAIHSGPTDLITERAKKMKLAVAAVSDARSVFQKHSKEHGCCSESVI